MGNLKHKRQKLAYPTRWKKRHKIDNGKSGPFRLGTGNTSKRRSVQSGFTSGFPRDVLIDILVWLPNRQSVFQCATVCKYWLHAIMENRRYLESSYPSFLFSFSQRSTEQFLHQMFPEQSPITDRRPTIEPFVLDFLPDWPDVSARASCGDLLLVSSSQVRYFICNPHTRQWIALPEAPPSLKEYTCVSDRGHGLVLDPDKQTYRIVIADWGGVYYNFYKFVITIFDSEIKQWISIQSEIEFPPKIRTYHLNRGLPDFELVATGDGILHWLGPRGSRESKLTGVVSLNPMTGELGFIRLPTASWSFSRVCGPYLHKVRLGVVRGRLRLSRVLKINQFCFGLRIWELKNDRRVGDYYPWDLVLNISFRKVKDMIFLLALHPTNENVVFVVCDDEILRLNVTQNTYQWIGDLPEKEEPLNVLKEKISLHMKVFPLVHSLWPAPVC